MTVDLRQVFSVVFDDNTRQGLPECLQDTSFIMGIMSLGLAIGFGAMLNVEVEVFQVVYVISVVAIFIALIGAGVGLIMRFISLLRKG